MVRKNETRHIREGKEFVKELATIQKGSASGHAGSNKTNATNRQKPKKRK